MFCLTINLEQHDLTDVHRCIYFSINKRRTSVSRFTKLYKRTFYAKRMVDKDLWQRLERKFQKKEFLLNKQHLMKTNWNRKFALYFHLVQDIFIIFSCHDSVEFVTSVRLQKPFFKNVFSCKYLNDIKLTRRCPHCFCNQTRQ